MWSSQLSRYTSCKIAGHFVTVRDFVEDVRERKQSCIHVLQAWRVIDKAEGAAFNHHWMVLRVREFWNTDDTFIAFHRMDTVDLVEVYSSLHDAVWESEHRKPSNPVPTSEFETACKRPLMLDYLFPMLQSMVGERYQLLTNNCHHFAQGILTTILKAGFYLETCRAIGRDWDPVCELELDNKKWHRPERRQLSMWQQMQCNSFLSGVGTMASKSWWGIVPVIGTACAIASTVHEVNEYKRAIELIYKPIDNDYKANMSRWTHY